MKEVGFQTKTIDWVKKCYSNILTSDFHFHGKQVKLHLNGSVGRIIELGLQI